MKRETLLFIIIVIFLIGLGFEIGWAVFSHVSYKQGQIDALNGKYRYEKVIEADTTYIKIK
jgi:predicted negative regulator of RcsB-dependent stress response